jgi:hypothetical protein
METWVAEQWSSKINGRVTIFASGHGFYILRFFNKEEQDLIFRFGSYLMGFRGMYLSPWTLDFNQEQEIIAALVWVRLPHLQLSFWDNNTLRAIRNKLDWFIDRVEPKGNSYSYARICMEVAL